jgi:hypothetical protein
VARARRGGADRRRPRHAWAGERGLDRLDVVKLDVEGAEAAALAGMADSLRSLRPRALVTEMRGHGDEAALRAVLAEAGYASTGVRLDGNELFRPGPEVGGTFLTDEVRDSCVSCVAGGIRCRHNRPAGSTGRGER